MKYQLDLRPVLKQTLHFSGNMNHRLQILQMNQTQIMQQLASMAQSNPFIQTSGMDFQESAELWDPAQGKNLKEELYLQLEVSQSAPIYPACVYIIESLDENGFFSLPFSQMASDLKVPFSLAKSALEMIQAMDPAGVAAASSQDSLILQCKRHGWDQAAVLLSDYQEELIHQDYAAICKGMKISKEQFLSLMAKIRQCTPFPCSEYNTNAPASSWARADLVVSRQDDELVLETPQIQAGIAEVSKEDLSEEMKEFLKEASFFLDGINRRNKTLLLVGNEIVKMQKAWFLYGGEKEPFTMKEAAQHTGLHLSTISRTVKDKHLEFEGRLYPLKTFFVSRTKAGSGKDEICQALRMYIDQEDPQSPWQDDELCELLETDELYVSRRTIAKYRKEMGIESSKQRKMANHKKMKFDTGT